MMVIIILIQSSIIYEILKEEEVRVCVYVCARVCVCHQVINGRDRYSFR